MSDTPKRRPGKANRGSFSRACGSWSLLLVSVALLRIVAAMKFDGDPRWLMGDGPLGLGNQAVAGLGLAAVAWLFSPWGGLLSALRRTPGLFLNAGVHLVTLAVFPCGWLIDLLADPQVVFRVDSDEPVFALTIDDGVHPSGTPQILDILNKHKAKATFFVLGETIDPASPLIRRILDEGHELANHQMTDTPSIILEPDELEFEIREAHRVLSGFGSTQWFRPGGGFVTERSAKVCDELGLTTVLGDVFAFDSHLPSARFIAAYLVSRTDAGSIVILHDGQGRSERTALALDRALADLSALGLRAETLSSLTE